MSASLVNEFTYVSKAGERVLQRDFLPVWSVQNEGIFDLDRYEWCASEQKFLRSIDKGSLHILPDSSGFLCYEGGYRPDNCTLLDTYGQERIRLTVPWQLTTANNPASNASPTSFGGPSSPYVNLADGKPGQFGVKAWVELAGEYYFELDWKTGTFLWGREIRF